jgi:hypothetical protein
MPQADIPNLDGKREISEATSDLWARLQPQLDQMFASDGLPDQLCHYTNFAGLKGILENNALWATYTRSLNDGSEDKYGTDIVNGYLNAFSVDISSRFDAVLNATRNFATCFCEDAHILSMWRGYAGYGGGFCLEFDRRKLGNCSFPPFGAKYLLKIRYGNTLSAEVRSAIEVAGAFAKTGEMHALVSKNFVKLMALKIKHPAFHEEKEWRIVVQNPPITEMKFRAGNSDVKPYLELHPAPAEDSARLPLRRVVLGPTLRDDDELKETVGLMLERYGYQDVLVEASGIPFRL